MHSVKLKLTDIRSTKLGLQVPMCDHEMAPLVYFGPQTMAPLTCTKYSALLLASTLPGFGTLHSY